MKAPHCLETSRSIAYWRPAITQRNENIVYAAAKNLEHALQLLSLLHIVSEISDFDSR
jgi:hypothetical protein